MTKDIKIFLLFSFLFLPLSLCGQQNPLPQNEQNDSAPVQTRQVQQTQTKPVAIEARPKTAVFGREFELDMELPVMAKLDLKAFDNKNFEIIKETRNQINPLKVTLSVISFNLGVEHFPQTEWVDEKGKRYVSDSFRIETKPTKTKVKTKGIADIRPPYKPFNPWIIISILIAAAAVFGAWNIYKRRKAKKSGGAAKYNTDTRPLHIIALEQIDNLLMEGLWEQQNYKLFYIRLTDILRNYLSARFSFDATCLTTRDLIKALKDNKEFKADIEDLSLFLKEADFVKFAKIVPSKAERDIHIEKLRTVINDSKEPEIAHTSPDDVLRTDLTSFNGDNPASEGKKAEPKIEILKSDEDFEKELNGLDEIKNPTPLKTPAVKTEDRKDLFVVSAQPARLIDLKVKSALEKQGHKYGQMLLLCFDTCAAHEPASEGGKPAQEEKKKDTKQKDTAPDNSARTLP